MLLASVFYTEVVNDKEEYDRSPCVPLDTWGVLHRVIPVIGQSFFEQLVWKNSSLGQSVHAFSYLDIDPTVFVEVAKVILGDDFFWDYFYWEAHVFVPVERRAEVEVLDINAK